jgi:hypothetical protein
MMNFLIEYLRETTQEQSVCSTRKVEVATLQHARGEAWQDLLGARRIGATGFQIRDARSVIVAIEEFDGQLRSSTIH